MVETLQIIRKAYKTLGKGILYRFTVEERDFDSLASLISLSFHPIPDSERNTWAISTVTRDDSLAESNSAFNNWGAYPGLMLEKDWRADQRRINDLTFRWLLISHYAERGKDIQSSQTKGTR